MIICNFPPLYAGSVGWRAVRMGGIVPAAKKAEAAESRALLERGKPLVFGQHPDKGDVAKLLAGRESWTVD